MRISTDNSAAVIIDFQERIFPAIALNEELKVRVPKLIEGLKLLKVPILVTEQYVKGLGPTIPEISCLLDGVERIEKQSFSCVDCPEFQEEVAVASYDYLIIAGIETHVCVEQTVLDLKRNGYHPVVIQDCVSSRNLNDKQVAIERMRQAGAIITTYEAILFELLRHSGTDTFRAISKIVK